VISFAKSGLNRYSTCPEPLSVPGQVIEQINLWRRFSRPGRLPLARRADPV
jgi:hypothetical protein